MIAEPVEPLGDGFLSLQNLTWPSKPMKYPGDGFPHRAGWHSSERTSFLSPGFPSYLYIY